MKKVRRSETAAVKHLVPMETEAFRSWMALVEHTALLQYEDGSPRVPGWFTVMTRGSAWCVTVKDPDSCSTFTAVGKTLDEAFDTANLLLGTEEAPREPDQWLSQRQRKGKGK